MIRRKDSNDMDGTSWQDASIAMVSIASGALLLSVLIWQISRIIQTGMKKDLSENDRNQTGIAG